MSVLGRHTKENGFACIGLAAICLLNIGLGSYSVAQFLWFAFWGIGAGVMLHVARDFFQDAQTYRGQRLARGE